MATTVYVNLRKDKTTNVGEYCHKDTAGGMYGTLSIQQEGTDIRIFLYSVATKKLLNAVRRIDRRLNSCQKQ